MTAPPVWRETRVSQEAGSRVSRWDMWGGGRSQWIRLIQQRSIQIDVSNGEPSAFQMIRPHWNAMMVPSFTEISVRRSLVRSTFALAGVADSSAPIEAVTFCSLMSLWLYARTIRVIIRFVSALFYKICAEVFILGSVDLVHQFDWVPEFKDSNDHFTVVVPN
jgi:hypothetical protein